MNEKIRNQVIIELQKLSASIDDMIITDELEEKDFHSLIRMIDEIVKVIE